MYNNQEMETLKSYEALSLEVNNLMYVDIKTINKIHAKVRELKNNGVLSDEYPKDRREWVRRQANKYGYKEAKLNSSGKYLRANEGEFKLLKLDYTQKN